jgi:hypothetical protein
MLQVEDPVPADALSVRRAGCWNAMVMGERSLRDIARAIGTDKEGAHSYAAAYERHLGHLRDRPIRLLEIGVGGYADPDTGGASLRMWKEFFPLAEIVGIDIHEKSGLAEDRITVLQGDQSDSAFLDDVAARFGPFDVVIDDGSHICAHVVASFQSLFRALADDGIYAIEDLQTSYWERTYGGSSETNASGTSMAFLKTLVDGLNYAEFDVPQYVPSYFDIWVKSVTFYHNLVFVQKGPNLEVSNFLPPHPRPQSFLLSPHPLRPKRRQAGRASRWLRRAVPRPLRAAVMRAVNPAREERAEPGRPRD